MTGTGSDSTPEWEAAETERFTDWLRERSEPAWTDTVEHRFVRELARGELDPDAFSRYLVQDYAFVTTLTGVFGRAVGDAPTMASKRRLVTFLDTLTDEESGYFERCFEEFGVSERDRTHPARTATTEAFEDLLERAAREGGYAETLAVLVPAEWSYLAWATDATEQLSRTGQPEEWYYAEWIDLHAVPEFAAFVEWMRTELDALGPSLSERKRARVERLFRRTMRLEVAFFDAAFEDQ
ncbi:TenA family protein [Haloferacaceae archaeon DSL9]